MPSNSPYLFEQVLPSMTALLQQLQHPCLRSIFTINNKDVQLTLTDNYILLSDSYNFRHPTHQCTLTFDHKFEVIYLNHSELPLGLPISIKIEREGCPEQLTFSAETTHVEQWALQLEKRINQRGFHKLFKAKKKIGKGAFATVYLAERLRDKKMVAVKAFSKEKQYSGDKGRQSLQNQVKLMRHLHHNNIMHLEGVYETENSIYVILEYLEGPQLNQLLKSNTKISPQDAKQIIQNILKGLAHLSRCRIIHRDLKPENIMFKKENSWDMAICDFGLATYADQEKYLFVRCGTPGFVAPQIINIKDMSTKSDPISDVFSAGIIFHYLLFGKSIFQGKKYNEILSQNRSCDFIFTNQCYSKLPSNTLDLLGRMLQKSPQNRISAQQALNHAYFTGQMDIEMPLKQLKQVGSKKSFSKYPKEAQTPTSISHKANQKKMQFQSVRYQAHPFCQK